MRRLWPVPATEQSDRDLERLYAFPAAPSAPWVCVNFVASADGAVSVAGSSTGLSDPADRRVFLLGRDLADVVLVGAGTARAEDYRGVRTTAARRAARQRAGRSGLPPVAVVSGRAALDPDARLFTDTTEPPIVLTTEAAPEPARRALRSAGARVVLVGGDTVSVPRLLAELDGLGLRRICCEGGPGLFGTLLAADAVDELRLTVAPRLGSGPAGRIVRGPELTPPTGLALRSVLRSGDTLLLRYQRRP